MTAGIATLLAALLIAPAAASAAWANCDAGDFCLFKAKRGLGGTYHFSGNDANLFNDHFEGASTGQFVANNTLSAWNNGRPTNSGRDQVLVSTGRNGVVGCIRIGSRGNLPEPFAGDIESFRWVTAAQCRRPIVLRR